MPIDIGGNVIDTSSLSTSLGFNRTIVQDGLVCHLDAANKNSYPGSGTTWTDLTGNGNSATINGSPTYTSNNGGRWTVDNVGTTWFDLDSKASLINTSAGTVGGWCRFNSISGQNYVFLSYGGNGTDGGFLLQSENSTTTKLEFLTFGSGVTQRRASLGETASTPYVGTDIYIIGVWDSSSVSIYINGVLKARDTTAPGGTMPSQSYLRINSEFNRTRGVGGYIYNVQMYNRALHRGEILANYYATKDRF